MAEDSDDDLRPGWRQRWGRVWKNPGYRFAVLFLLFLGIGAVVYPLASRRFFFVIDAATRLTAQIEYAILRLFTTHAVVSGSLVTYDRFAVSVIEECTGVYEMIIFSAAVIAFPTSWAKRGVGLALGIPTLYVFNVLRILVLLLVGNHFPKAFDFMHLYFWQATLIVMITSVWLAWIFWVVQREPKTVVPVR